MSRDIVASSLLFDVIDCLHDHEKAERPLPADLCSHLCAGLRDIAEHVMALEAVARAADLLGERDFKAAVTSLSVADRRALARSAMRRANGAVVPFPSRVAGTVLGSSRDVDGGDAA